MQPLLPSNRRCITEIKTPFNRFYREKRGSLFLLTIVDNPDGLLCFHKVNPYSNVIDSVGKDGGNDRTCNIKQQSKEEPVYKYVY